MLVARVEKILGWALCYGAAAAAGIAAVLWVGKKLWQGDGWGLQHKWKAKKGRKIPSPAKVSGPYFLHIVTDRRERSLRVWKTHRALCCHYWGGGLLQIWKLEAV